MLDLLMLTKSFCIDSCARNHFCCWLHSIILIWNDDDDDAMMTMTSDDGEGFRLLYRNSFVTDCSEGSYYIHEESLSDEEAKLFYSMTVFVGI